jgi:type I restriction enzyme S subunit
MKQDNELPLGWEKVELRDISIVNMGQSPLSEYYNTNKEGLPFFQGKAEFGDLHPIAIKWCSNPSKIANKDDILISVRAPVGTTNIASEKCCIGRGLAGITPLLEIPNKYIFHFLRYSEKEIDSLGTGTTFKSISGNTLRTLNIPLAPLNEQHRIVTEIEKQFSRLDETVSALKRIQANLKRYKASVLKSAVEGKLTAAWREQHPALESAQQLLERILKERRAHWEAAELAKMQANGKPPKDNQWKLKYKEPVKPDISNLPELPAGWMWTISDQLFWFITSGSRGWAQYYSNKGAIFLRIGNLSYESLKINLKDIQYVELGENKEGTRTRVQENDILISITAAIGMIGIIPSNIPEAYINQHIALTRPVPCLKSMYLALCLSSKKSQDNLRDLQRGATKIGLGLHDIKKVYIPLPPIAEQAQIVAEVEKRLSVAEEVEQQINRNLKRAEHLRQAILKRAFSGKLVPQNPADEPASVLLESINVNQAEKNIKPKRKASI